MDVRRADSVYVGATYLDVLLAQMMSHMWKFLVWLDYTANDKLLGGRWETISSRCYRNHKKYWYCRWLMKGLDSIQRNHCKNAYLNDKAKNPFIPRVDWEV